MTVFSFLPLFYLIILTDLLSISSLLNEDVSSARVGSLSVFTPELVHLEQCTKYVSESKNISDVLKV